MNKNTRWIILGGVLLIGLVLLAHWLLRSEDGVNAPPQVTATEANDPLPAMSQPPVAGTGGVKTPPGRKSAFATLRGRVIDAATRKPIREFEVHFHGSRPTKAGEEAPGARAFKDDDGRFEWEYLPPGDWTVTASAAGYQRFELNGVVLPRGGVTPEIVLPMRRGNLLRGRIYDEESGAGIAAASIGFREAGAGRFEGNWRMRQHVKSAKDGTYVLDGVPPGRITLNVYSPDHAGRELDVEVGEANAPLDIALSAGGTIAGRLTAADGVTPVAGAVGLFHLDAGFGGTRRSGDAGEFSFEHLEAGRYQLTGQGDDGSVEREIVLGRNQRIDGIVLALGAGSTIRGLVTGLRPDDFKHLGISLRGAIGMGSPYGSARVDERGGYTLRGVQPGRVEVVAEVSMRRQLVKTVDVPEGSDITVNFDFPAGARLSGRVTHVGKPLARIWISPRPAVEQPVYSHGTATASDGTYAIEDLPTGEYVLFVGDFRSKPVQVSGDTVFDVDIPLAQLSGRILEEGGKVPVVDADVEIWPTQPDAARTRRQDRSNHFGQFGLAGLEPGQYLLTAYKPGYEMIRQQVAYDAPISDLTLQLRRETGVEIRVRQAENGKPIGEVYVIEMIGERNGMRLVVPLNEDGEGYIPSGLASSKLSFVASGFAAAVVDLWDGQRLDLKLTRERPALTDH